MSMNVYIKLVDLTAALRFVEVAVSSELLTAGQEEPVLEISVAVRHKTHGVVHGELHYGGDNLVMFSRHHQEIVINICTAVGIPFRFF